MEKKRLYSALTYAGALPFAVCAVLPWIGVEQVLNIGTPDYISRSYGLAIASFLAGAHWGTFLYHRERSPTNLFLTSNAIVLAAWSTFLINAPAISLFVLVLAFLYLLFIDFRLFKAGLLIDYYFALRRNVTAIVVICLIANIAAL